MKIHLCTPYFRSQSPERQAEFDDCLRGNLDNPVIDRVTLFVDDDHIPPFEHAKMRIVDIPRRLTYRDWLEFALAAPEPHISVLSNTDILFDETVGKLETVFRQKNRFVTLSRHERIGDGLERHRDPKWSQDVWAISTADEVTDAFLKSVDFGLGVPRCDNKIVYEAAVHGWDVINPFPDIRAIHLHESQVRGYHKTLDRTLIGGMGFAQPSDGLSGRSKVELSIWPLKTKNITQVRIVRALEDWNDGSDQSASGAPDTIVSYDEEWQYPAITEKQAFDRIRARNGALPANSVYLGFPWATLIDKMINRPADAHPLVMKLERLKPRMRHRRRVVTVCQHIHLLKFQSLFADARITDIFWSHKVEGQDHLPDHPNVRLHPFPLFPVQTPREEDSAVPGARKLLFSFVGARARPFYVSQVRSFILEELGDHPLGRVVGRDDWHYNKIVYDHQILKKAGSASGLIDNRASAEFVETLTSSIFSLCPSGSGPNSIRLWESLAAGAIPVVMSDTLDLPGPRALWEQAAVICREDRVAVRALPETLQAIADDPEHLKRMRHAGRQLWMLYGPDRFTPDVEALFVGGGDGSVDGEKDLTISDTDFLELADKTRKTDKTTNSTYFLLLTAANHAFVRPKSFGRLYHRHEMLRKALESAAKRCAGSKSADGWLKALDHLRTDGEGADQAISDPILSIMAVGRNANRSPLHYDAYRREFDARLQFVTTPARADMLVFAASANIPEHYAEFLKGNPDEPSDRLAVLSEEPLWDTTWGNEFDAHEGEVDFWKYRFKYAVLNHLTTDIFKFAKVPYFVTTDDRFAVRYASIFRRNASMRPEHLLALWRNAPIRQAYFAEKRTGDRYEFERPELDLYGYCGFRTRLAEAAPSEGVLRVGQGWSDTVRRQELADWHLDKLATLDRKTFIASAVENTHHRDYITEKPFDAFGACAVPVYAASPHHRISEIVPDGSYINVFGLDASAAAKRLRAFEPDLAFAERYLDAQKCLAKLFGDVETLLAERRRVVDATVTALEAIRRGEIPRQTPIGA